MYNCKALLLNLSEEMPSLPKKADGYLLYDKTGRVELIWFQGISYISKSIQPNAVYSVFGASLLIFNGLPTITHPEIGLYNATAVATSGYAAGVFHYRKAEGQRPQQPRF